jgi:hypothetical protein
MERKKLVLIIVIVILCITAAYFSVIFINKSKMGKTGKSAPASNIASSQNKTDSSGAGIVYLHPDKETLDCLDKFPMSGDPKIGMTQMVKRDSYADYTYRAVLDSVEEASANGCQFVKLNLTSEPQNQNSKFSIYLPQNMPSPGTDKNIMPKDMESYLNKKIEFQVRYGIDPAKKDFDSINAIFGWQLDVIYGPKPQG